MTNEPVRSATRHAIKVAKENGAILSFDPNIREPLWKDMEDARTQMAYGLSVCDILKFRTMRSSGFRERRLHRRDPHAAADLSDPAHPFIHGKGRKQSLL